MFALNLDGQESQQAEVQLEMLYALCPIDLYQS